MLSCPSLYEMKWFGPSNRTSIDILETAGEIRLRTDVSVILNAALSQII